MSCAGVPPQSSFMIPEELEEPYAYDIDEHHEAATTEQNIEALKKFWTSKKLTKDAETSLMELAWTMMQHHLTEVDLEQWRKLSTLPQDNVQIPVIKSVDSILRVLTHAEPFINWCIDDVKGYLFSKPVTLKSVVSMIWSIHTTGSHTNRVVLVKLGQQLLVVDGKHWLFAHACYIVLEHMKLMNYSTMEEFRLEFTKIFYSLLVTKTSSQLPFAVILDGNKAAFNVFCDLAQKLNVRTNTIRLESKYSILETVHHFTFFSETGNLLPRANTGPQVLEILQSTDPRVHKTHTHFFVQVHKGKSPSLRTIERYCLISQTLSPEATESLARFSLSGDDQFVSWRFLEDPTFRRFIGNAQKEVLEEAVSLGKSRNKKISQEEFMHRMQMYIARSPVGTLKPEHTLMHDDTDPRLYKSQKREIIRLQNVAREQQGRINVIIPTQAIAHTKSSAPVKHIKVQIPRQAMSIYRSNLAKHSPNNSTGSSAPSNEERDGSGSSSTFSDADQEPDAEYVAEDIRDEEDEIDDENKKWVSFKKPALKPPTLFKRRTLADMEDISKYSGHMVCCPKNPELLDPIQESIRIASEFRTCGFPCGNVVNGVVTLNFQLAACPIGCIQCFNFKFDLINENRLKKGLPLRAPMNATLHTLLSNLALHRLYIEKYLQKMQQLHNNEIRTVYFAKNYDVLVPYTPFQILACWWFETFSSLGLHVAVMTKSCVPRPQHEMFRSAVTRYAFFGHDELITQMEPGHAKWADVLETAQLFKSAKCDVQHTINCLAAGFSLPLLDSTILQSTYCKFFNRTCVGPTLYQSKDLAETQKRLWPEFLKNNDGNIVPFESVALTLSSSLEPRESVPNCKPVAGKRVLSSIYAASIHLAVARTECLINHLSSSGEKPLENPYRIPEFHLQFCGYYAHTCRCHCHNMHTVPKGKVCYLSPLTEQQNVKFPQVLTFPEVELLERELIHQYGPDVVTIYKTCTIIQNTWIPPLSYIIQLEKSPVYKKHLQSLLARFNRPSLTGTDARNYDVLALVLEDFQ